MNGQPKLYIAGMGMITPIGANTAMTAAAVRAGVSGYAASRFFTEKTREPITMARVPREVFDPEEFGFDKGSYRNIIMMSAIIAMREALASQSIKKPIPLLLTVTEPGVASMDRKLLVSHLADQKGLPIHVDLVRYIDSGRAAGIEGLVLAHHLLTQQRADYVLLGGSDSHADVVRLSELEKMDRLLTPESRDGFAPGEGAGFLLLTARPELALVRNGYNIALQTPGITEEPGHLHSREPYRGDGLDQAFKKALGEEARPNGVHSIYSSMNGEHHWAKEYGVAYLRNRDAFCDPVGIEHPADCYGDLGAATAPVLIALAAEDLFKNTKARAHLVYSSSDQAKRGAVVVEKIAYAEGAAEAGVHQQSSHS